MNQPSTPVKLRQPILAPSTPSRSPFKTLSPAKYLSPSKYGSPLKSSRRQRLPDSLDNSIILDIQPTVISAAFAGKRNIHAQLQLDAPLWTDLQPQGSNELESRMIQLLSHLFVTKLLVTPREISVIVLETSFMSNPFKLTLSRILKDILRVSRIVYLPVCLCALISARSDAGLVVEFGDYETTVTPIYDLRLLTSIPKFTRRNRLQYSETKDMLYFIHDNEYDDENECSVPAIICQTLADLDIDLRRPLVSHIVFVNLPDSALSDAVISSLRPKWPNAEIRESPGPFIGCSAYLSVVTKY